MGISERCLIQSKGAIMNTKTKQQMVFEIRKARLALDELEKILNDESENLCSGATMGDDEEVRKQARFDFKVLQKVESLFSILIITGNEALNQLEQIELESNQMLEGE